ncbi:MAG TPA: hypothetical protein VMU50_12220, partial [Polyangia bacterium]|nr:hypothetical protein [Polyangia bacterium]
MFSRRVGFFFAVSITAASCAGRRPGLATAASPAIVVSGIWDGFIRAVMSDGAGSGDTRIEKQEWHLSQTGETVSGYYIAAVTFVSGDGRPYVCNREPQFSTVQRYDVSGRVKGGAVELQEIAQKSGQGLCDAGSRRLASYQGSLQGDVLTLTVGEHRQTLYRSKDGGRTSSDVDSTLGEAPAEQAQSSFPSLKPAEESEESASTVSASPPADVSGLWIWEHRGAAPGGDEKQEREEWHVTQ